MRYTAFACPIALAVALAACGEAPAPAVQSAAAPAAEPGRSDTTVVSAGPDTSVMGAGPADKGQSIYSSACVACHGAGVAGAPKLGDKSDWGPRIKQGTQTLYTHAVKGYTGKKGVMPPKGGMTALPDADVRAAVDYMVAKAK